MKNWKPNDLLNYLMIICFEEGLYRVIVLTSLLMVLGGWMSVILSSVLFGIMHFIKYDWRMVLSASILGIGLGWLYIWMIHPLNFICCIAIHLVVGSLGVKLGLMKKWRLKQHIMGSRLDRLVI